MPVAQTQPKAVLPSWYLLFRHAPMRLSARCFPVNSGFLLYLSISYSHISMSFNRVVGIRYTLSSICGVDIHFREDGDQGCQRTIETRRSWPVCAVLSAVFTALIQLGFGFIVGVLGMSKIVDHLLNRYRRSTYYCIMGIFLGYIVAVQALQGLTGDMILPSVVCIAIGLAFGFFLSRVSAKYAEETISEKPTGA